MKKDKYILLATLAAVILLALITLTHPERSIRISEEDSVEVNAQEIETIITETQHTYRYERTIGEENNNSVQRAPVLVTHVSLYPESFGFIAWENAHGQNLESTFKISSEGNIIINKKNILLDTPEYDDVRDILESNIQNEIDGGYDL